MGLNKLDDFKKEVVFERNETGNEFWESQGFTVDLVYRNKSVADIVRIDT